jgi:hypothetical protein
MAKKRRFPSPTTFYSGSSSISRGLKTTSISVSWDVNSFPPSVPSGRADWRTGPETGEAPMRLEGQELLADEGRGGTKREVRRREAQSPGFKDQSRQINLANSPIHRMPRG